MLINMDELKQRLQERQCKLTPQRKIILEVFLNNQDQHLSAEDVHTILKKELSEIGLATVYRTLELLCDMEILHKIDFGDGRSRFEINAGDKEQHYHHHLICLNCGMVKECEDDLLEDLETNIAQKSGFVVIDHQLKMYGYCEKCQKIEKK